MEFLLVMGRASSAMSGRGANLQCGEGLLDETLGVESCPKTGELGVGRRVRVAIDSLGDWDFWLMPPRTVAWTEGEATAELGAVELELALHPSDPALASDVLPSGLPTRARPPATLPPARTPAARPNPTAGEELDGAASWGGAGAWVAGATCSRSGDGWSSLSRLRRMPDGVEGAMGEMGARWAGSGAVVGAWKLSDRSGDMSLPGPGRAMMEDSDGDTSACNDIFGNERWRRRRRKRSFYSVSAVDSGSETASLGFMGFFTPHSPSSAPRVQKKHVRRYRTTTNSKQKMKRKNMVWV